MDSDQGPWPVLAGQATAGGKHLPVSCARPPADLSSAHKARTRKKGTLTMSDRLAAHWPPTIRNLPARIRRCTLGVAILTPLLVLGGLGSIPAHASQDSGLAGCAYPLSTQDVPAADYPKIRAQFAGSRWPDLRIAGTAYVDLAMQLPMRVIPTDTRPSGSISGCPPPARSTDGERQHPGDGIERVIWTGAPGGHLTASSRARRTARPFRDSQEGPARHRSIRITGQEGMSHAESP